VAELCGTPELPCPRLSPPSGGDRVLTQLPLVSLEPKENTPFTMGDYVDDDELYLVIAGLQSEEPSPPIASVGRNQTPLPHLLITVTSLDVQTAQANQEG
jgi:hypothetical protein